MCEAFTVTDFANLQISLRYSFILGMASIKERMASKSDFHSRTSTRIKLGSNVKKRIYLLALSLFDNSFWPGGGMKCQREDKLIVAQLGKLMWCQTVNVVIE